MDAPPFPSPADSLVEDLAELDQGVVGQLRERIELHR